jgi:hypothetical protein
MAKAVNISSQAMQPLAATLYGEAADQDYDTKVKIASTMLNRLESGKKEFGAEEGLLTNVLSKGYYAFSQQSPKFKEALSLKFPDKRSENSYKENLAIVSGLLKGTIDRDVAQFYFKPEEIEAMKKKKSFDFKKVKETGKSGPYKFYSY